MIILWGTRIENADWQEEVITETNDKEHLVKARAWAKLNGFDRLREVTISDVPEKPDFIGTIRI